TSVAVDKDKILSYEWNLGNGTTSVATNPKVQYNIPGSYEIVLKAVTVAGCRDSTKDFVLVRDFVEPIIHQSQGVFCINKAVIFDASLSKGVYHEYLWEFGDGKNSIQKTD